MKDTDKTKDQLVQELEILRQRVAEAEAAGAEHKRVESQRDATLKALRENEARYRRLFEDAVLGIFQSTPEGKAIVVNPAFARMFGYESPADVMATVKNVATDLFADPQRRSEIMRRMAEEPDSKTFENLYRRKDGSTFVGTLHVWPVKGADGCLLHLEGFIEDITARKQAEEEVHQQAETLAALHETALDLAAQRSLPDLLRAIVVRATALLKARSGDIYLYRLASDDLESALSYNLEPDFKGTVLPRRAGVSVEALESGQPLVAADHREGQTEQYGQACLTSVVTVPIRWGDQLLGVLDLADDARRTFSPDDVARLERFTPLAAAALENNRLLGDVQQQMDRLKEAQAQLVQAAKLAGIGELAAGVAHELNNPLTSILGFAMLLLNTTPPDASARGDLEIIANQARRGRDIVRNLLDFARQTKPQRLAADVNQVLRQALDLIRQHLEKSGVVIEEDCAPDVGLLTLDSGQMKQVFLNLITNAAQAMPQGGKLSLCTACVGSEVAISVSDTGQGIPPQIRERIFEPFFTTKATGEGTGLGLSVSLGIVQAHGGRISVESPVGRGSTFTVWLPIET